MKHHLAVFTTSLLVLWSTVTSCAPAQQPTGEGTRALNTLSPADRAAGWQLLFDGHTMDAWRGYKQAQVPDGWKVVDGTITKSVGTGDIVTKDQFGDFELDIQWKLGTGGNSGIFYRGTEEYDHVYWSAPEYQLLDDANAPDG